MAKDSRLKCSFCGKTQDEVYKIIAGPGVNICDECVNGYYKSPIKEDGLCYKEYDNYYSVGTAKPSIQIDFASAESIWRLDL